MPASPPPADAVPRKNYSAKILWLLSAVIVTCAAIFVVMTRHWPMVGDAALLRYTVFLIQRGWAPYRDLVDINMPGAYWMTDLGMHLAHSNDVSWRIFDIGLIALAGAGYFVIARPHSRFAALFATVMLLLVHGQDGVQQAGQRDQAMAVLLVWAVAFLLEAARRDRWHYLVPFGLAIGLSATIKPTAGPLGAVLLLIAAAHRAGWWLRGSEAVAAPRAQNLTAHERRSGFSQFLKWTAIGLAAMAVPLDGMLLWLASRHALGAWLTTQRVLLPYYASLDRLSLGHTLAHSISPLEPLAALWLVCALLRGPAWSRFERALVGAGVLLNLLALLAQAKPLPYQRYPLLALLLLLMAVDLTTAWQARDRVRQRFARYVALAGLGYGALVMMPRALLKVHRFVAEPQEFDTMLRADLRSLGGNLNRSVQCIDTINECLPTLGSLQLEPATGVLYDLYLFGPENQPAVREVQQRFMNAVEAHPPTAFVVVSGFFLESVSGYRKLDRWPAFEQWLDAHYKLTVERTPLHLVRWWSRPEQPTSYRIYVLRSDPALSH